MSYQQYQGSVIHHRMAMQRAHNQRLSALRAMPEDERKAWLDRAAVICNRIDRLQSISRLQKFVLDPACPLDIERRTRVLDLTTKRFTSMANR